MKRKGNLYHQVYSIDNLILADKNARKEKGKSREIKRFDRDRGPLLQALHEMLVNKTYKTSPYRVYTLYEHKAREISQLPYYPDRIVQHADMNILKGVFIPMFTADSYSSIPGKGVHKAVRNMQKALKDKEHTTYCLKIDLKKFYPSVDHEILKQLLRRKFKDNDLLEHLDEVIESAPGLPIGNYLSQYFANFYLTWFDH